MISEQLKEDQKNQKIEIIMNLLGIYTYWSNKKTTGLSTEEFENLR